MSDEKKASQQPPSLEMRVAAIEDKLSGVTVTQEEMRAYQKVASLMAGSASAQFGVSPLICISPVSVLCFRFPIPISIPQPITQDCIQASVGGATSSTGFETFGR